MTTMTIVTISAAPTTAESPAGCPVLGAGSAPLGAVFPPMASSVDGTRSSAGGTGVVPAPPDATTLSTPQREESRHVPAAPKGDGSPPRSAPAP